MLHVNLHYLKEFEKNIQLDKLNLLLLQRNRHLFDDSNLPYLQAIAQQPEIKSDYNNYEKDTIIIGNESSIHPEQKENINQQLKSFCPWRKGPFEVFGNRIDAEWKSDLKWTRFFPYLNSLQDKVVADIGCNNGYFMFKAAAHNPSLVLGIDPTRKFKLAFHYLNQFAGQKNLHMELMGFEDLHFFTEVFDTIFCMGILYHHQNPMQVLEICHQSMKKGGQLVLETMGISAKEEICLFPQKRYANMRNVWFVPSQRAVENMLHRAGFREVHCVFNEFLDTGEQRRTEWADVDSLAEFLDPENSKLTMEGYEAPSRIYFIAVK